MNRKFLFTILVVFLLALQLLLPKAHAKDLDLSSDTLPEKEGTYDVPGHTNMKLHVFVHGPREAKPASSPTISPLLVCQADPDSSVVVPATGWHLPTTWSYTLNTNNVPSTVGGNNLSIIANNAFSQWTAALSGKVNISKTSFGTSVNRARLDGQNIIAWGRTSGSALATTYTWYYPSTGTVAEVDTIMNQKFPWFWNSANNVCTDQNSYDAQDILTHELGHWMGLDDRYDQSYVNNTMFGYGSKGETKKDTLTSGDISGVSSIYP